MTNVFTIKRFVLFFWFAISGSHQIHAQKAQAMHWYFGDHYGLDFSEGTPQPDYTSSIYTYESCTTISDKHGELLFYTNGGGRANQAICGHIWNRNHEIMDGGNLGYDLGGGYSAAQGVLAFEKPGADNIYCLFTVDELETLATNNSNFPKGKGFNYFEIDMNANGGLGKVSLLNQHLFTPAFEYQAATIHDNCEDYWVIAPTGHHLLLNDPNAADSFYVYLVSNNGPALEHIIPIPEGNANKDDEYGFMKISPDGSYLLCGGQLYNFDNSTGLIQFKENVQNSLGLTSTTPAAFSPNSRFLYEFKHTAMDSISVFKLYQYDLTEPDLPSSAELLLETDLIEYASVGGPQLAPDGKLYFMIQNGFFTSPTALAAIPYPNTKGAAAGVNLEVLTISNIPDSRFLRFGQYSDHIFKYDPQLPGDDLLQIIMPCETATPTPLQAPPGMDCYLWSDGTTTDATIANQDGLHWVEYWSGCQMGVDSFEILYRNDLFEVNLGTDYTICGPDSILLEGPGATDAIYEWQDGSDKETFNVKEPGLYWLLVEQGLCKDSDSIFINQKTIPHLSLGTDTTFCLKDEIRLSAYHPDWKSYQWQDGFDRSYYDVNQPGTYQLTIENECGTATDDITVDFLSCTSCPVYIPNVFSPDRNAQNDEFKIFTVCKFVDFQLQVFDRWGNQVFGSTDPDLGWDGTLKGQLSQIGAYVYRLDYKWVDQLGDLQEELVYGDLLLLR